MVHRVHSTRRAKDYGASTSSGHPRLPRVACSAPSTRPEPNAEKQTQTRIRTLNRRRPWGAKSRFRYVDPSCRLHLLERVIPHPTPSPLSLPLQTCQRPSCSALETSLGYWVAPSATVSERLLVMAYHGLHRTLYRPFQKQIQAFNSRDRCFTDYQPSAPCGRLPPIWPERRTLVLPPSPSSPSRHRQFRRLLLPCKGHCARLLQLQGHACAFSYL